MQQFDITVPANGTFPVHAAGRYIKYVSGNNGGGDCSLIVVPGAGVGGKIVLQPGQAYRIAQNKATPDSWVLQNAAGGATILGKVVIGDGRIDDNTFSGVVQTVDGGKARTLSNSAFGLLVTIAPVAGQYGRAQLFNPANSGVRLVIETAALLGGGGAIGVFLQFNQVALANAAGSGISKLAGGAGSAGKWYWDTTATQASLSAESCMIVQAASEFQTKFVEPMILPPGWGLVFWSGTLNMQLQPCVEWYEEPNV